MPGWWLLIVLLLAIVFIVYATGKLKLNAFLALLLAAYFTGLLVGMPGDKILSAITGGFGKTLGYIGIVIAAGTIMGTYLEKSGGALSMAEAVLNWVGKKRAALAMSITGFFVSIPVFCDSGFVILSPLNNALAAAVGESAAVFEVALSTGLYATHCLVPPTPGPIAAAGILKADLGTVIGLGLIASIPAMLAGYWYAVKVAKRWYIKPNVSESYEDLKKRYGHLPEAWRAFTPIFIPIILILLKSLADFPSHIFGTGTVKAVIDFIGNPNTALIVAVFLAMWLLVKKEDAKNIPEWTNKGLANAAIIILITGAGGAFGSILKASGIGKYLGASLSHAHLGILLPFIISAALKTAQGSSTVALITTPALVAPILPSLGLSSPVGLAITVLSIGAGSMVVSHVNDSYFWVVNLFSGNKDVTLGYKTQTAATFVEGIAAVATVLILSLLFVH